MKMTDKCTLTLMYRVRNIPSALMKVSVLNTCLRRIHSCRLAYQYLTQANKVTGVPCKEDNKIDNVKKFDGCGIVVFCVLICSRRVAE
jgi:hypothetical protein